MFAMGLGMLHKSLGLTDCLFRRQSQTVLCPILLGLHSLCELPEGSMVAEAPPGPLAPGANRSIFVSSTELNPSRKQAALQSSEFPLTGGMQTEALERIPVSQVSLDALEGSF